MTGLDASGDAICGICGGPGTRTEITAGGDGLTPVILCDADVCTPLIVFPAARLGAFLRAMLDPEGGVLDAVDESVVRRIERRVEEATRA